ncbi:hypothetical protein SNAG_0141 [Streptococcus sp. NPS 308]|nr:hypothetical protein SNAG_0141 [Streptococcus sp. NPS 308]
MLKKKKPTIVNNVDFFYKPNYVSQGLTLFLYNDNNIILLKSQRTL